MKPDPQMTLVEDIQFVQSCIESEICSSESEYPRALGACDRIYLALRNRDVRNRRGEHFWILAFFILGTFLGYMIGVHRG